MAWRQMLVEAIAALEGEESIPDGRERLRLAACHFWRAKYSAQSWSLKNREQAEEIANRLLAAGVTERTIEKMNEREIKEVSQELVKFCKRMGTLAT